MQQSLSRAQEEMKKAAEGEKMKKRLSADTTQVLHSVKNTPAKT